jgi:superfamily II DNA or RNA helicase/HKD family nuclease
VPTLTTKSQDGSALFIVDNSEADWKVAQYILEWCQLSSSVDIATGFFEIGGLLALKDEWQKVNHIRILMGDEISLRTKQAFSEGLRQARERLDASLETEKETNDFLDGVPAILEAIRTRKIECRIYRKDKFHAKAYITHSRFAVTGSAALVGSSNFTRPGLSQNVELNVQITGAQVTTLQEWYEVHWAQAEDVTEEILRTIERHVREYSPFDVFAKALHEFFRGHEMTPDEWEALPPQDGGSRMLPVLDDYQRDGYRALLKIARQHGGAFLCDGVGLGKTFVGLMLIERLVVHEGKNVVLLVPKSARKPVWESAIARYLPHLGGDFSGLVIFNHTDLQRTGDGFPERFARIKDRAHVFIIDEAHHFRNKGIAGTGDRRPSRYRQLYDLLESPRGIKQLYMLTATPINNGLIDLQHMIELFARDKAEQFKLTLGINSLRGHFRTLEKQLKKATAARAADPDEPPIDISMAEVDSLLSTDRLFDALVVQRSRAYVKQSQIQSGVGVAIFPTREEPQVAEYSVKKTYGRLLDMVDRAFARTKPLFALCIYYPSTYYKGPETQELKWEKGRQEQVVGLIRVQFLKRFESSVHAFRTSCERLLIQLLAFVTRHSETDTEKSRLERWMGQHAELIAFVRDHQPSLFDDGDAEEDILPEELLDRVDYLPRADYRVEDMLSESMLDLDQVAIFLDDARKFKPTTDDKLPALVKLLKTDKVMSKHKALIFTEYAETARYLRDQLIEAGIEGVDEIDSGDKRDRGEVIRRFAPYYNGTNSPELVAQKTPEIRILISTDVLSEGLNLQDATRLINYDLHWNPVRLMQRIGRVDRRMNPEIEARILADHPDLAPTRGKVAYWNFLPPDELEELLSLYSKVAHKTLRISRTLGIEGKKLLRPEDDYEALRDLNARLDNQVTPIEAMRLEYRQMLLDHPELAARLAALPGRVFSGKAHPAPDSRAVFFCYNLPAAERGVSVSASGQTEMFPVFSEGSGTTAWYLFDLTTDKILDDPAAMMDAIRSTPDTPRHATMEPRTLADIRKKVERHIKSTYLKQINPPLGVGPTLKCWMELN